MESERPSSHLSMRYGLILGATGTLLFGSAGTWVWWNGWVLLAFTLAVALLTGNLFRKSPELLEERRTAARVPAGDRFLTLLLNTFLPLLMLILAGFDKRWGWSHSIPAAGSLGAAVLMVPAVALTYGAMKVNPFFSSQVRLQPERGQKLVRKGPYQYLRHPGYAGALLYNLAAPFLLGSLVSFGAGFIFAILMVARTLREDRMLLKGLQNYREYAQKVRYRLIPGVW